MTPSSIALLFVAMTVIWISFALVLIMSERVKQSFYADDDEPDDFDPKNPRYRPPTQPLEVFHALDGKRLGYRQYRCANKDAPLLIFIHGSTNYSGLYEPLAKLIVNSGAAHVILPDLRGHGPDFARRGIASYVGQLEDDIAGLIRTARSPNQSVILGGHSLGGGFAIRFAAGKHRNMIERVFLIAPYLNTRAPTNRPYAGGFIRVLYRRIVGLAMLGVPKLFGLSELPVVQFNFSKIYHQFARSWLSTDRYNFAMTMSFGPRQRWRQDIRNLPPFLLVIGDQDQAFYADQYEPVMSQLTDQGRYVVLPDVNHVDASLDQRTVQAFQDFLQRTNQPNVAKPKGQLV